MTEKQQHKNPPSQAVQNANARHQNLPLNSLAPIIQIQAKSKNKKEVINLESSEEKREHQQRNEEKAKETLALAPQKNQKEKKVSFKCQLCKGSGRKSEMKMCTSCKNYCHIQCLDENELKKKYICDKCKMNNQEESKQNKKIKKQEEKIETEKAVQKRLEKEKRKDDSNKTLQKFKVKYPYYIGEGDKLKFPIEDKLLFIYKEYFEPSETKPQPSDHPLIPSNYLGDFLELENFIVSFGKEFVEDYPNGEFRKSVLFTTMNCEGSDIVFQKLLGSVIKIYLKDIYEKNKTENVKLLNDHCFFILLGILNDAKDITADFVAIIGAEILRYLSTVPSMKNAFQNFQFPQKFTLESKLSTLIKLIQGLSEVDGYHEMVGRKSEKIAEMTKDKADYISKLKNNEAEALSNKQKIKQILNKNKEAEQVQNLSDEKSLREKEIEKNKKKTQKMTSEGEKSEKVIKQFKTKIVKIAKMIPFTISEVMFLGYDRNKSIYYFYLREPNRIYVRYHNFLLHQNQEYRIFEGKEKIMELIKSLNTKGIHEKRLFDSINYLIKEDVIRNLTAEEEMQSFGSSSNEMVGECNMLQDELNFKGKVIEDIMELEENFTTYLTIKNYQWTSESKREEFRFGFPYIDSLQALKEAVRNLQENFLFVEVVQERNVVRNIDSDSNNEDNGNQGVGLTRRKKPIRIWGINSEKIKKFWVEYLETCENYAGVWICTCILRKYVEKYLEKKMDHIREQERKQIEQREKKERQRMFYEQIEKEKEERNLDRLRSRNKEKKKAQSSEGHSVSNSEGIQTRQRRLRASNRIIRNKNLTIDSDDYDELFEEEQDHRKNDDSMDEDECAICGEVGDVICCDSCPRVFHISCLKIKEVPEGEWNCVDCLQRIANSRQTRSRVRRINK